MGNNYNIKRNHPEPDSAEIAKFKNFEALLQAYQENESNQEAGVIRVFTSPQEGQIGPRLRRWIVLGAGLAAAAAIALLLIVRSLNDLPTPAQAQLVADAYFAKKPYLNPPLNKVPQGIKISVDAAEGASLDLAAGTRLIIPRKAFQTDRGQLIESGEVNIYYREMHDAVDFFMAGVPMTYDSANTRHFLQSAGMIEIIALQNGQPVEMAPGKIIRIELQSMIAAQEDGSWPSFKVYYLDTVQRNWMFFGKSDLVFEPEPESTDLPGTIVEKQLETEKAAILAADPQPQAPVKPVKSDSKAISFDMDFLIGGNIPVEPGSEDAVAGLEKGAVWQVLPNSPSFNPNSLNLVWKSARLKRLGDTEYELTLINEATDPLRLLVQPVITGKEYETALKKYDLSLVQYQQELAIWEKRTDLKLADLENRYYPKKDNIEDSAKGPKLHKVRHVFGINSFGIWNCDRPAPLASSSFRIRVIEDQNGNTYPNQTAYLSDQTGQSIYQLHTGRGNTVYFDSKKDYLLWLMTPEGKIALVKTKAEWASSNPQKGIKLKVQIMDQRIRNEADIRKILNPR